MSVKYYEVDKPRKRKPTSQCIKNLDLISNPLFAAAPDMLEALNEMVKLAPLTCNNAYCTCIQCEVVRKARRAIAKAVIREIL